jgi:DNA-binding NarL/FixJ family response regulator
LIVGGNRIFTDSLVRSLTARNSVEVVGAGLDAAAAAERASALRPDVVVFQVDSLETGGIEAARELDELEPRPFLVMLAQPASVGLRRAAETVNADAYVVASQAADVMHVVLGLVARTPRRKS